MKPLIIGIDPGTTLGCAIIDTESNLISVFSSKQHDLSSVLMHVINYGKPILVGCDKKSVPKFVQKFARNVGARIVTPMNDLLVEEKRNLVDGYGYNGVHELDALASARYVFKNYYQLFQKIDAYVKRFNREDIRSKITELVVLKGLNISVAADEIDSLSKAEFDVNAINDRIEVKKEITIEENAINTISSITKLKHEITKLEKDNLILKNHNNSLKNKLSHITNIKNKSTIKTLKVLDNNSLEKLKFKDNKINFLYSTLKQRDSEIAKLRHEVDVLNGVIADINKYVILKRLKNLSFNGLILDNETLGIKDGDVLYVDNINNFSQNSLDFLSNKVGLIVYNSKTLVDSNKLKQILGFALMPDKELDMLTTKYFVIVRKGQFLELKSRMHLIADIIDDYRSKRLSRQSE